MSEVSFAKQFLTTLDSRPSKLSSDHVADPRKLPAQSAYILPRMPNPFPSKQDTSTPASGPADTASTSAGPTTTLTLKPLRASPSAPAVVTLPKLQPHTTSIYDIKVLVARRTGYTPDKLKLLWQKKPVTDSKTLQDVVGGEHVSEAEMAVMYTGAPTNQPQDAAVDEEMAGAPESEKAAMVAGSRESATQSHSTGQDVEMTGGDDTGNAALATDEFWEDLKGFVLQRCRDEAVAEKATSLFRQAWRRGR